MDHRVSGVPASASGSPVLGPPCQCVSPDGRFSLEQVLQLPPPVCGGPSPASHMQAVEGGGEEPEESINYKVKQIRKKPSGWKLNHGKRERMELQAGPWPIKRKQVGGVCTSQGRGQAQRPVLISSNGFGHRSPRTGNSQSCQSIAEGAGCEGREG